MKTTKGPTPSVCRCTAIMKAVAGLLCFELLSTVSVPVNATSMSQSCAAVKGMWRCVDRDGSWREVEEYASYYQSESAYAWRRPEVPLSIRQFVPVPMYAGTDFSPFSFLTSSMGAYGSQGVTMPP